MTYTNYHQIKALFSEVCDLPEAERVARLAHCDQPAEVVHAVRALLAQTHVHAQRFAAAGFASPVLEALSKAGSAGEQLASGDVLGAWRLIAEIGHGGMGTVFKAERYDGQFEQQAAIKVLRGLPSADALARLAQERQIVANLAHPNIARLLDGGATPHGRPYLVLEYIEGIAIDRYCAERGLSIQQILNMMLEICAGLSYAHQRLVVHCDLKPSNILVNHDARPMLLDFGIAHRLQDQTNEQANDLAGDPIEDQVLGLGNKQPAVNHLRTRAYTPGFASPEQREGAVLSTATDVFGLGRLLDQLLQPTAVTKATQAVVPTVLPAPLRAIIAQATAADPAQRYSSVNALAEDLQRYLRHAPVTVLQHQRWYRLRCFMRRHALSLSFASVTLIALIGALIVSNLSLQQARQERARAELAATRANRTADFLGNILSAADPDRARDLDTSLLREILDQAAAQANQELAGEPIVLSQIQQVIGNTYYQLGEYNKSAQHLRVALDSLPNNNASLRQRLDIREKIADTLGYEQSKQALAEYQSIYQERLAAFGANDPDTLKASYGVAFQLVNIGDFKQALQRSASLQPILERELGVNHAISLQNLQTLSVAQTELAQFAVAEATLKTLLDRRVKLLGAEHSQTLAVQNSLAIFYLRQARFAEAETLLRSMLSIARKRLGDKNFKTINATGLLASALRLNGKLAESGIYYKQALDSASQVYGDSHPITLRFANNYANFEVANQQPQAALARLAKLEPLLNNSIGADHPDMSDFHRTRAKAQTQLGQIAGARSSWQRALSIDRKTYGDDQHPLVKEDLAGLAALPK